MSIRINIGCGRLPAEGWCNYDNSWSIRLSKNRVLTEVLTSVGLISKRQRDFIAFAAESDIVWADAARRIPNNSNSADALYTSHMLEHLPRDATLRFLTEARRVLRSGGIIRISVPDIRIQVDEYLKNKDAESFIRRTELGREQPRTFFGKLSYLFIGDRGHQWMYDGPSLCKLLEQVGFVKARVMQPGTTSIDDPGGLNLEERAEESVFVEAVNP